MNDGWDPAEDGWLSGFTDGEGCFEISSGRGAGVRYRPYPRFSITLRADDIVVLQALAERFGGTVSIQHPPSMRGGNPKAVWRVTAKAHLSAVVNYFDRFPLHAKKRADYAIWREAIRAYCARGRSAPELPALRDALVAGRVYGVSDPDAPAHVPQEEPQLRLVS